MSSPLLTKHYNIPTIILIYISLGSLHIYRGIMYYVGIIFDNTGV